MRVVRKATINHYQLPPTESYKLSWLGTRKPTNWAATAGSDYSECLCSLFRSNNCLLWLITASSSHKYRWADFSAFESYKGEIERRIKPALFCRERLQSLSSRLSIKSGTKKPEKYKSPSLRLPAINLRNCYNLLWCWEFCQEMINSELSGFRF